MQVSRDAVLRRLAWLLALFSLTYCLIEGTLSVTFAAMDRQISLMIFGVDSLIEVASASLVVWRLLGKTMDIGRERKATLVIGVLLVLLFCAAAGASIAGLVRREHPETTTFAIIISSISVVLLTGLWLAKRKVAVKLKSSTLASDAVCSFACARLSLILLLGSVIYKASSTVWWIDAAAALVLSMFFLKEGAQMIKHALSDEFSGGSCGCQ